MPGLFHVRLGLRERGIGMRIVFDHSDDDGNRVALYRHSTPRTDDGVFVTTSKAGTVIPDDKIPDLVSALQNYMSRRAREKTEWAKNLASGLEK